MIRSAFLGLVGVLSLVGAPHSPDSATSSARSRALAPETQQAAGTPARGPVSPQLEAPRRAAVPESHEDLWLVPPPGAPKPSRALADFAAGIALYRDAKYDQSLPYFTASALKGTLLEHYGRYYAGLAYLNLARPEDARTAFAQVRAAKPAGYLSEAATLREAEAASSTGDFGGAVKLYEGMARGKSGAIDAVLLALAVACEKAGQQDKAAEAYARLYYEYPLSDLAAVAATALGPRTTGWLREDGARFKRELDRAERLFAARRYEAAHDSFELLRPVADSDPAELVAIRVAECDHFLGRYEQARSGLAPLLDGASRKAEARFFYLTGTRELDRHEEYVRRARELVRDFPDSSWAQETLNNLGTHYILVDEDQEAARVFAELFESFPKGRYAARAAWKAGWWAYKNARFSDAARLLESGAAAFPRSDYRPSYLYWAARAREQAGDASGAASIYRIVHADYRQSYYGRLTNTRLEKMGLLKADAKAVSGATQAAAVRGAVVMAAAADTWPESPSAADTRAAAEQDRPDPPNADLIRALVGLELYDLARDEVLFALQTTGETPRLNATLAWTYYKENDLRRGIIYMKRAYPQFLSVHGAALPNGLLRVIYPMDYWPLISRYAKHHGLDPFLVAALINQESSFIPDARSRANAIGLMQIMPSTGRRLARQQRLRFTTASLTRPEYNIRLGTAFFADLSRRLGGDHLALASYNAGAHRVSLWRSERPGLEQDEFIDDIPFPETQTYVKKILGSAEDYRALYRDLASASSKASAKVSQAAPNRKKAVRKPIPKKR